MQTFYGRLQLESSPPTFNNGLLTLTASIYNKRTVNSSLQFILLRSCEYEYESFAVVNCIV
jgi:hypothetical protein